MQGLQTHPACGLMRAGDGVSQSTHLAAQLPPGARCLCVLFPFMCLSRYKTLQTNKDGVRFTTKALEAEAAKLQDASHQYEEVQRELVEQVR